MGRVVLDTNVLLAAFGTCGLCEAVWVTCLTSRELVTSEHILAQLQRHLGGKFRMPARRAAEVVAFIRAQSELVEPDAVPRGACRDPDDLPVLGTVAAGRAELLVTGDAELLALGRYPNCDIGSPRQCHDRMA